VGRFVLIGLLGRFKADNVMLTKDGVVQTRERA
jgi:hypothetical protein